MEFIDELILEKIDSDEFMRRNKVSIDGLLEHFSREFDGALENKDGDRLESIMMIGFKVRFPENIIQLIYSAIGELWHVCHEDMISLMQEYPSNANIPFIMKAIELKPKLSYLEYDDYGSYYKKCLWALSAINSKASILVIEDYCNSDIEVLSNAAKYRLKRNHGFWRCFFP